MTLRERATRRLMGPIRTEKLNEEEVMSEMRKRYEEAYPESTPPDTNDLKLTLDIHENPKFEEWISGRKRDVEKIREEGVKYTTKRTLEEANRIINNAIILFGFVILVVLGVIGYLIYRFAFAENYGNASDDAEASAACA